MTVERAGYFNLEVSAAELELKSVKQGVWDKIHEIENSFFLSGNKPLSGPIHNDHDMEVLKASALELPS